MAVVSISTVTPSSSVSLKHGVARLSPDFYTPISLTIKPSETKPMFLKIRTISKTHLSPFFRSLQCRGSSSSSIKNYESELEEDDDSVDDDDYEDEDEEDDDDNEDDDEEEEEEMGKSTAGQLERNRLFVGNLPYSMTSAELTEIFNGVGEVDSAEIIYDRVTDRSRGFGFVTMGSVEEAQEAINMLNNSQVGGRSLKVNFPEVSRGGERLVMEERIRNSNRGFVDSPWKLYVGNLSWKLTSEKLRDVFANQPGLLGAKVMYDKFSAKARGFGFVSFASEEAALSALEAMDGLEVEGRPLRLNHASRRVFPTPKTPLVEETNSDRQTDTTDNAMQSIFTEF